MRFQKLRPHPQSHSLEEKIPEIVEESSEPGSSSLPLEWVKLAPFVQAFRSRRPARETAGQAWQVLRPRIEREKYRREIIGEYLRETFWPRLITRLAVTAVFLLLIITLRVEKGKTTRMQAQLQNLQSEIQALKAGM